MRDNQEISNTLIKNVFHLVFDNPSFGVAAPGYKTRSNVLAPIVAQAHSGNHS